MSVFNVGFCAEDLRSINWGCKTELCIPLKYQPPKGAGYDNLGISFERAVYEGIGIYRAIDYPSLPKEKRKWNMKSSIAGGLGKLIDEGVPASITIPYALGDLIVVSEAYVIHGLRVSGSRVSYRVDNDRPLVNGRAIHAHEWQPRHTMPEWASRLTLEVTEILIHRLHDISEFDAMAEGVTSRIVDGVMEVRDYRKPDHWFTTLEGATANKCLVDEDEKYRMSFLTKWASTHGEASSMENPWVAVVKFRPIKQNISAVLASRPTKMHHQRISSVRRGIETVARVWGTMTGQRQISR